MCGRVLSSVNEFHWFRCFVASWPPLAGPTRMPRKRSWEPSTIAGEKIPSCSIDFNWDMFFYKYIYIYIYR